MKEHLFEIVGKAASTAQAQNEAREYLQARILGALQRSGAVIPLALHGGTALRFLYASSRRSEDPDFALEKARLQHDFRGYLQAIRSDLEPEGYSVTLKASDQRAVHSAFIRFPVLLYELGLVSHRDQVLTVKSEVDTNPPPGAVLTTTVVRRYVTSQLQHHHRASLLAGRLHATLQHPYVRGRDLYDLLWYLDDPSWPPPNLALLNNALEQTDWTGERLTEESWRGTVRSRLKTIPWDQVAVDVRPFLEGGRASSTEPWKSDAGARMTAHLLRVGGKPHPKPQPTPMLFGKPNDRNHDPHGPTRHAQSVSRGALRPKAGGFRGRAIAVPVRFRV